MNLLHMKYAVEIADKKSINKAAETLFVGQSALSRAVKELESSLGVTIFQRSTKGMEPTPEGEVFLRCARTVLKQVDDMENMFIGESAVKKRFSVSGPRASYISAAFSSFVNSVGNKDKYEFIYRETNSMRTIKNVLRDDYKLGILRYASVFDGYYKTMAEEKGLAAELICEFEYVLLTSKDSPIAKENDPSEEFLADYTEITHADPYVPSLPLAEVKKEEISDVSQRMVFVFERASQFELLSKNPFTYMWVSPIPKEQLDRFGLVQIRCGGPHKTSHKTYKDVLIHRKDYALSDIDRLFIEHLVMSKRSTVDGEAAK